MGIDAEIFCKSRKPLTDDEIIALARDLAEAVGPREFSLDPSDGRHALSRLGCWVCSEHEEYGNEPCPLRDEPHSRHMEDGPEDSVFATPDVLRVNQWNRYYGVGYERGPFPTIAAICEWMQANVGDVWYGGDSGGCVSQTWVEQREELWKHWYEFGSRPYYGGRGDFLGHPERRDCVFCRAPMARNGWGGSYQGFDCLSCGRRDESRDGGVTWKCERNGKPIEDADVPAKATP